MAIDIVVYSRDEVEESGICLGPCSTMHAPREGNVVYDAVGRHMNERVSSFVLGCEDERAASVLDAAGMDDATSKPDSLPM